MDFIVVTYWWGDGFCENTRKNYMTNNMNAKPLKYSQMVNRLSRQCAKHGLLFDAEKVESTHYQKSISYKAEFIEKMLNKWRRPVLYLDCDMQIHKCPTIFSGGLYDFMAFNWNGDPRVSLYSPVLFDWNILETSGGMMYFNYTKGALRLISAWKKLLQADPNKADDRLLSMAFKQSNAVDYLRYYWVPMEYFYIPQYYHLPQRNIVISHSYSLTDEKEAKKMAGTRNRIPKEYHTMVAKHAKHHKYVVESNRNENILQAIKHRNKAMKRHGIDYTLYNSDSVLFQKA